MTTHLDHWSAWLMRSPVSWSCLTSSLTLSCCWITASLPAAEAEARVSTSEAAAESSVFCRAVTCLVELQTYVREDFTITEKS